MAVDEQAALVAAWFDYQRRSRGSRAERKALEMGEPADAVRAAEQVRAIIDDGGTRAVGLVADLLDHAANDDAVIAVAAGPLEELLYSHWDDVIERIEALARAGGPIRRALSVVWLSDDQQARLRPWTE